MQVIESYLLLLSEKHHIFGSLLEKHTFKAIINHLFTFCNGLKPIHINK